MSKQLYFHHDSDSEENCFSEIHFQNYMKEFDMNEITVFKAKIMHGQDFFYCSKYQEICEKGEGCGKDCSSYKPRNGKSGRCYYNKEVYEPGEKVILKINNMKTEIWKHIKGWDERYMASNLGRVKSFFKKKNGIILKQCLDKDGYYGLTLMDGNIKRYVRAHRIIAFAFLDNSLNKPQINHINGIKNDNRVENLEWCTSSENQIHSVIHLGKKGFPTWKNKFGDKAPRSIPIIQLNLNGEKVKEWECAREVERTLGISFQSISHCLKNRTLTAGKYKWKYKTIQS